MKIKLLFVCSGNRDRSPTAEQIYKTHPRLETKSAGTSSYANVPLSEELVLWSDTIVVMEQSHEAFIREHYVKEAFGKPIFCLDVPRKHRIPEDYRYMEEPLVELIREKMEPVLELIEKFRLLKADLDHIRSVLANPSIFEDYYFSEDLGERMKDLGISANALAGRCEVKHSAVGKWLKGTARPNGKESMKKLGMALGMREDELSEFLLKNKYTGLYSKNPLDVVCKRVLAGHAGDKDIVRIYRAELEKHPVLSQPLPLNRDSIATTFLSGSAKAIDTDDDFDAWLEKYAGYFEAADKNVLPSRDLTRFIHLHIGQGSVNNLYVTEELPDAVRRQIYPIRNGNKYALRRLREKLIVFGLYSNMTDADIDQMLAYARLMPLTKLQAAPADKARAPSKMDAVLVAAMRCAHERCPFYEYTAVENVIDHIVHIMAESAIHDRAVLPLYEELKAEYLERFRGLRNPYEMPIDEADEQFEDWYADHLSDYMRDVLYLLVCCGDLQQKEIDWYMELIKGISPKGV